MKIQTKLTLIILAAVVTPMLIVSIAFSSTWYRMVIADNISQQQSLVPDMVEEIQDLHDTIKEARARIGEQKFYQDIFYRQIDEDWGEIARSEELQEFEKFIDQLVETSSITAVRIYMRDADATELRASDEDSIFQSQNEVHTYWKSIFSADSNLAEFYCSRGYMIGRERELGDCAIIYRIPYNYQGRAGTAFLSLYYSSQEYVDIMNEGLTIQDSGSFLFDSREMRIAETSAAIGGMFHVKKTEVEKYLNSSNSFVKTEFQGETVYLALYKIQNLSNLDWYLVSVIPEQPLVDIATRYMLRFGLICLACILFAVGAAIWMSRSITKRIANLSAQMVKVQKGRLVPMEPAKVHDEVGTLIDTYNYMTDEMKKLMDAQIKSAEDLKNAEFQALQAQINPHFLYNTMDMIHWQAMQGKYTDVSQTVQDLSKFYKLTLSRKKAYSIIEDELEHARTYMDLQNRRFKGAIDFVVDVPDELTQYRIPKLTFQPILENAILHGILEKKEKSGTVVLTAWQEGEDIAILISDDGVGMPEEIRSQILLPGKKDEKSKGTNIAIANIHQRLQLLYGNRYGLSYESRPGEGTEVTILIPMHYGDTEYVRPED